MIILSIVYSILAFMCCYAIIKNGYNKLFLIVPVLFCLAIIWANILNNIAIFGMTGIVSALLLLLPKNKKSA